MTAMSNWFPLLCAPCDWQSKERVLPLSPLMKAFTAFAFSEHAMAPRFPFPSSLILTLFSSSAIAEMAVVVSVAWEHVVAPEEAQWSLPCPCSDGTRSTRRHERLRRTATVRVTLSRSSRALVTCSEQTGRQLFFRREHSFCIGSSQPNVSIGTSSSP